MNLTSVLALLSCLFFAAGFLSLRYGMNLEAAPQRSRWKLVYLLLLAVGCVTAGSYNYIDEKTRLISLQTVTGVLTNLHAESHGRGQLQHFKISLSDGMETRDLHSGEGEMFTRASDGQVVEATFTQETGYVGAFRVLRGPSAGYAYNEPDGRDTLVAILFWAVGVALILAVVFQRVTDP